MFRKLDQTMKGQMIGLWQSGKSATEIARILQVCHKTVYKWIKRHQTTGSVDRKRGSGRPPSLTNDEAREVVAVAGIEPFLNSVQIRDELQLDVTPRTIRNTLNEAGLQSRVAARKPGLTDSQRRQRLHFALSHLNWNMSEWGSVLFTDESCIQSFQNAAVRVYRPKNYRFDQRYIQNINRSGRISVSVWGCMSAQGIGTLHRIEGRLNGPSYCDILEHVMIPVVLENHFQDGYFLFQQDNSPIHTSKVVKTWCHEHDIRELDWPSNAADLNPIENVWALWKQQMRMDGIATSDQLWRSASRSWDAMKQDPDIVHSLIESMPRRLQQVIDNNGNYTSY